MLLNDGLENYFCSIYHGAVLFVFFAYTYNLCDVVDRNMILIYIFSYNYFQFCDIYD